METSSYGLDYFDEEYEEGDKESAILKYFPFLKRFVREKNYEKPLYTPLDLAIRNERHEIVQLLILKGANPLDIHSTETLLHYGAEHGLVEACKILIDKNLAVNAKDKYTEKTPLHYAAEAGHLQIAHLLIDKGADVHIQDEYEKTPLHYAAENGFSELSKLLVDQGADRLAMNKSSYSILHAASRNGLKWLVEECIQEGADIHGEVIDPYNKTGKKPIFYAVEEGHMEVLQYIIERGADIRVQITDRRKIKKPLFDKWLPGYRRRLRLREEEFKREYQAMFSYQDDIIPGDSLLHCAIQNEQMAIAKILIEKGLNVNAINSLGLRPLHYAARKGDLKSAMILIDKGAELNAKDIYGKTPLHHTIALSSERYAPEEIDEEHFEKDILKHIYFERNREYLFKYYVKNDDKTSYSLQNLDDTKDWKAHDNLTKILKDAKYAKVLQYLIQQGLDVNAKDNNEKNPLHFATDMGYIEIAKVLIDQGAEINPINYYGNTPLYEISINYETIEHVLYLIDHGAVKNETDSGIASFLTDEKKPLTMSQKLFWKKYHSMVWEWEMTRVASKVFYKQLRYYQFLKFILPWKIKVYKGLKEMEFKREQDAMRSAARYIDPSGGLKQRFTIILSDKMVYTTDECPKVFVYAPYYRNEKVQIVLEKNWTKFKEIDLVLSPAGDEIISLPSLESGDYDLILKTKYSEIQTKFMVGELSLSSLISPNIKARL